MIKNEGGISTAFTLRLIYVKLYIVTKTNCVLSGKFISLLSKLVEG